jgi:hypothetical protein
MSEIQPNVSEHEARAVAEGARETTWEAPSFLRELFLGRLDLGLIHPWPEPDAEEQERGEKFLAALERFLREQVDAERIERDARIPQATSRACASSGRSASRSRGSTAASSCRSTLTAVPCRSSRP